MSRTFGAQPYARPARVALDLIAELGFRCQAPEARLPDEGFELVRIVEETIAMSRIVRGGLVTRMP